MKVDEAISNQQMQGFSRNAQRAMVALQNGNYEGAATALSDAYSYYPDGMRADIQVVDNPKGGGKVLLGMAYDEETGKPAGQMILTPEMIAERAEMLTRSPADWYALTKDRQMAEKKFGLEVAKFEETKRHNRVTEGISAAKVKATAQGKRPTIDAVSKGFDTFFGSTEMPDEFGDKVYSPGAISQQEMQGLYSMAFELYDQTGQPIDKIIETLGREYLKRRK